MTLFPDPFVLEFLFLNIFNADPLLWMAFCFCILFSVKV